FKDYRRVLVDDLVYNGLGDGSHELTVTATDLDGKSTSATVNFSKEPPYVSQYEGEILYMPFDGDYVDLISFETATEVGEPGFVEEEASLKGAGAYAGAEESYLTFPGDRFQNGEFSAIFWLKINAVPDRAGILVMSPPLIGGTNNDLNKGFRFFRENAGGMQRFILNAGSGDANTSLAGWEVADVDPNTDEWVNLAFTISATETKVYIDGQLVREDPLDGIDWTDCNILSIMSGAPNFTQWNHLSDQSFMDELRIFDRAISQEEVQQIMADDSGEFVSSYTPTFDGEMFYMPFDDDYKELFRDVAVEAVGNPGFAGESVSGSNAYAGAADSYLTFPTNEIGSITTDEFSATLWYKMNADPNNGGILTISPEDTENADYPGVQNLRTSGFRFFREGNETRQVFKLNVGTGDGEAWFDGQDAAALDPTTTTDWVHLAFTISDESAVIYINGEVVSEGTFTGIDWSGCDLLSIGSGAPRFTQWNHFSDLSFIDELRLYDKALSQEEVQAVMGSDL
ncbi:MAG TPA: LamG domain-containing protein, partial [Pricia sp.]|nr:LamG domain-containing protein [Pricia sp.]